MRVTVQLIDGRDGTRRWSSHPYENEQSGILAAQDEIAQDVARALSVTLDVGDLNSSRGGTMNLEAARRYWEWREITLDERWELENQRRKVRLMRDAVRLDPQFVLAWDSLAQSLETEARFIGDMQPELAARLRDEAEQAWRHVAELAPDSWVVLCKRSDDLLRAEKWAESEAVARQLLESGPFSFERSQPLINVLFATGRINETIELQSRVMALEPRALFVSRDLQFDLYAAGRFDEAEAEYRRSQALHGNHSNVDALAFTRALAQPDIDPRALRDLFQRSSPVRSQLLGDSWSDLGDAIPDRGDMLRVLRKGLGSGEVIHPTLADALGDRDLAFRTLQPLLTRMRGENSGVWYLPWLLVHSGARADPRFKALMREAGLAAFWRQSGKWPDFCSPVGADDFECH
jgi:tetratricopeptide (TPR) repeat protein